MFSCTLSGRNSPLIFRSSVRNAIPRSIAAAGESMSTGTPSMRMSPDVARLRPKIVSASSVRLDPTSPAMPRISPARTSNDTSENVPSSDSPFTESSTRSVGMLSFGNSCVSSRPTIIVMSRSRSSCSRGDRPDDAAVAHDGHLVRDSEDFVDLVRDVDDRAAAGLEVGDDLEQLRHFALRERRRRLVHDEDLRFVRHGPRNLDHLPLRNGQVADAIVRIDVDAERAEQL